MFHRFKAVLLLLATLSVAGSVYGQSGASGTILGTVTDNSGAAMANATVDVTNTATNIVNHVQTTSSGDFTVPYLAPGNYSVTVQAPGFQKTVTSGIMLVVGQQARVNVTMKPGAVAEIVEVRGNAAAIDTDTSAVSQIVTTKQVDELPLNGRNFLNLLFITPGAVQTGGEQAVFRQGQGNAISINGGRPESNNYTLDGLTNLDPALQTPAVILSQDAIQEFKVLSDTYSAEYGYSANQVAIVSKGGTNSIHGTVFEFFRNDALDAHSVSPNRVLPANPELRQNQFGFVLGGPAYIPKVYDGRNKTFWVANYEGWRIVNGNILSGIVPTPAELQGNFSGLGLPQFNLAAGSPCRVALANAPNPSTPLPCMPGDPQTGAAFPGGIVPQARWSRLAQVAIAAHAFPSPSAQCSPGSANNPCGAGTPNNFQQQVGFPETTNQQTYRIDQELGKEGKIFFRFTKAGFDNKAPQAPYIDPTYSNNTFSEQSTSWTVSHTISIGPESVNNFRFGHLSATAIQGTTPITNAQIAALGFTGLFTKLPPYAAGMPTLNFEANILSAVGSPVNTPTTSDTPTWEFADSLTMIRGRHTLSMGADYRHFVESRNLATNYLGGYTYGNATVLQNNSGCTAPGGFCGTGNELADFLLGYYTGATPFVPGPLSNLNSPGNLHHYVFNYFAPYVQDDWKVSSRLTLNLGLRWDWRNVPYEQNNDMFWIDPQNMPGGSRFTGGGLCFANKALLTDGIAPANGVSNRVYNYCGRRNPADSSKTPFAPRFGFAFRPFNNDKTAIRGGYGIFWDSAEAREIDNSGDFYPYVLRTSFNPLSDPTVAKTTDGLFPSFTTPAPITPKLFGSQFVAVVVSYHPRNPYVQQYTFGVERELAKNTTLEVNYVGNRALHLLDRENLNTPPLLTGTQLANCQAAFNSKNTVAYGQNNCGWLSRRPLPNFGPPAVLNSVWEGYSNYNAGNIKLERRGSNLTLLGIYTYSKSMDDKSAAAGIGAAGAGFAGHMDDLNPRLDYAPSDFDVRHRFVTSAIYALPLGRGQRFLGGANRAENLLIGGWQLGVIATFQRGFPFSVTATDLSFAGANAYQSFGMRANQTGSAHLIKNVRQWFNTSAFTQPAFGVYGNSGRNILTQPGINNWDINLAKTFQFTERLGFQLRVETFNTFNHTQFGVDPNSPGVVNGTSAVAAAVGTPNFGQVTGARPARIVQLGGKILF